MEVQTAASTAAAMKRTFLIINCIILAVGICGGPLIMRLYFLRGSKRIWFSSWLETGGSPIILLPLLFSYKRRRSTATTNVKFFLMKPRVFFAAAAIGVMTGLDDYLYVYGVAKLPVSTSALIIATQLAFTAAFAFLLVKQKFKEYSINAVVLLTVGAVVLGLHTGGDRPEGESNKEYWLGFFLTVAAAALYGFILPLIELMNKKARQELTYTLVMEIQLVMCFFATVFCTVGMIINNDFQLFPLEHITKGTPLLEIVLRTSYCLPGLFPNAMPRWLVIFWISVAIGLVIFLGGWSWQLNRSMKRKWQ